MKRILVTGACGYIGSHTLVDLLQEDYDVVSVDSHFNSDDSVLSAIQEITGKVIKNCFLDLSDEKATRHFFTHVGKLDGIIHFAALKAVGESVAKPIEYYKNNLNSLLNVLEAVQKYQIDAFIFSSSCTVYGQTEVQPVTEASPFLATGSPYGRTKQMGESIIQDVFQNLQTKAISLRYFNPAGAHHSGKLGELPINPPLNLVPSITETAYGIRSSLQVHGTDYDTKDGSCIRDFIHVEDLARAHRLALEFIFSGRQEQVYEVFNIGIGNGVSVLEAISSFESVSNLKLNKIMGPRRPGDIPYIYSASQRARDLLGWTPLYDINDIMQTAWNWEQKRRAT